MFLIDTILVIGLDKEALNILKVQMKTDSILYVFLKYVQCNHHLCIHLKSHRKYAI